METAKEKIREHLKEDPLITIAQVRDMFATSRKSAKTDPGIYGQYQGNEEDRSRERKGWHTDEFKTIRSFRSGSRGRQFFKGSKTAVLTQPTISAHISSLEKELNARLL